jgi:hypothetical protein
MERKTDRQGNGKARRLKQSPPNFLQRVEQAHLKDLDSAAEHAVQRGEVSAPEGRVQADGVVENQPRGLDRAEARANTGTPALGGTTVSRVRVVDSAGKGTEAAVVTSDMFQDVSSRVEEAMGGEEALNAHTESDPKLTAYYVIMMSLIGVGLGIVVGTGVGMSLFP